MIEAKATWTDIFEEFVRLGISSDDNLSHGVSVGIDEQGVIVFNAFTQGIYKPSKLLALLQSLSCCDISLEEDSPKNIWLVLSPVEI